MRSTLLVLLCVIGGAILPYVGSDYHQPDAASEADAKP